VVIESSGFWTREEIEDEKDDVLIFPYFPYEDTCSSFIDSEFRNSPFIKEVFKQFDTNCLDKHKCDISLDLNLLKDTKCYDHMIDVLTNKVVENKLF
jgi:hypothetical protein